MRNLKAEYQLASNKDVRFIIKNDTTWLADQLPVLAILTGAKEIIIDSDFQPEQGTPASLTELGEVYLPLKGLIDIEAELTRIDKEITKTQSELDKSEKKLSNENFVSRAKPEVVEQEKTRLSEWHERLKQLNQMRADLQA
jgi:valyl-tRNA synthetase